jgi:hypothetical protein
VSPCCRARIFTRGIWVQGQCSRLTDFCHSWAFAGLSRIIGGIHVDADNYGGQILGTKVGGLAYQKVQMYYDSDNTGFNPPGRPGRQSDTESPSHTAALLDPKSASAAELLAACNAITIKCGPDEMRLLMEADDLPSPSAAELKVQRTGGLPFAGDDYGNITPPPCFACNGNPGSTGPPPITPNNTEPVHNLAFLPPSPPPVGGS